MSDTYDPGAYTVDEVKQYVTENPDEAEAVYEAEKAGKNRTSLTSWMEEQSAAAQSPEGIAEAEHALEQQSMEQVQATAAEPPPPEELPESQLPPALSEIGLVGMRALTSGVYTTTGGSTFFLTPGVAFAVSEDDASELAGLGVVVTA